MRKTLILTLLIAFSFITGCANTRFGAREKGALTGAAAGAGLGAIVGNQFGNPGAGVAIGSGIGALTGGVIGEGIDRNDERFAKNDARLRQQDRELAENRRMLDELRAGGAEARITDRGVVVNLPDVLFEFDRARLTPEARGTTREISKVLRNYPNRSVLIEGHTDSVGTEIYNQRLSDARARSVAVALEDQGVSSRRISTRGFGESRPIASNDSEAGRTRNRRVEVVIQKGV